MRSSRSRARPRSTTRRSTSSKPRASRTADLFGPGTAIIVLGLGAALAWGAGDFGGGWTARRAPVLGVSLVVQALGVGLALALAVLAREPVPDPSSIAAAAAAGVVGAVGILSLYQGLAVGRMGVVAPIAGVIAASLPVVVGIARDGPPATPVLVGIGLALVAVVLVSFLPGHEGQPSGVEYGVAAGVGIGIFNVLIGGLPDGQVFGPLTVMKLASAVAIGLIVVLARRAWRVPRAALPLTLLVGCFDMAGNGLYVLATQAGRLDVAATLSSLYPVTTVLLAVVLLRERINGAHALGIVAAGAAIVLITSGSAG
jgi:drug/metabolite transporter (DMT)-like permease